MLTSEQLLSFLVAVALIELTPGPNMGYLLLVAGREGWRRGMVTVAGVTLGLAFYLVASLLGLAEIALQAPWLYQLLRWAGVAYLVWLAWDAWRDADPESPSELVIGDGRLFLRGLMTNLLNPKAAIFYIAVLPAFLRPDAGSVTRQAGLLGLVHLSVALLVHTSLVAAASRARPLLAGEGGTRRAWISRGFALGLLGVAAWVAFTTRR